MLTVAISQWQAGWTIVDTLILPEDYITSNLICLGVGYGAMFLLLGLDGHLAKAGRTIARQYEGDPERKEMALLVWEDFVYVVSFWGTMFLWRGGWNLNATYLLPDPVVGGWVNNLVATAVFLLLQCMSYASCCGVGTDGGLDGTEDSFFQNKHLRHYIPIWERTKVCKHGELFRENITRVFNTSALGASRTNIF